MSETRGEDREEAGSKGREGGNERESFVLRGYKEEVKAGGEAEKKRRLNHAGSEM